MSDKIRNIVGVTLVLLCLVINITQADQIDRYDSNITVLEDGTIDVVETIQISTNHEEIKLGITRDIPTHYYFMNKEVETPVNVLSVMRNGKPENFWTQNNDGYVEIFTGSVDNVVDNYLDKGQHTFIIHWQSKNHIRSFENYDELYFNAIGHNWRLPIYKATVTLTLPASVEAIQSAAYYGIYGQKKMADVFEATKYNIGFSVPSDLQSNEGLTIATGFTKGIVPSIKADKKDIIMDKILGYFPAFIQPVHIILFGAMIIMLVYLGTGFILKNIRKPKSHRVFMVRYSPPDNINLDQIFALRNINEPYPRVDIGVPALLVDLHAKGYIHLDQDNQQLIVNTELDNDAKILTNVQKFLLKRLALSETNTFSFAKYNPILEKAIEGMASALNALLPSYKGRYLQGYAIAGYGLLVAILAFSTLYLPIEAYMAGIFMVIACIKLIVPTFLHYFSPSTDEDAFIGIFAVLAGFVFAALPLYGLIGDITDFPLSEKGFMAFYSIAIVLISIICFCLLLVQSWTYGLKKEYIDDQQQVLEFKHFLAYTKEEEYKLITPNLFEEYLPYAIILGVDKNWLKLYDALYPAQFNESYTNGAAYCYGAAMSGSLIGGLSDDSESHHNESSHRSSSGNSRGSGGSGSAGGGSSGGGSGGGGGGGR